MGAPQIITIAMLAFLIGVECERNGRDKKGKYNAWEVIVATVLLCALLIWGGFFS